jgi:hypothetical protein
LFYQNSLFTDDVHSDNTNIKRSHSRQQDQSEFDDFILAFGEKLLRTWSFTDNILQIHDFANTKNICPFSNFCHGGIFFLSEIFNIAVERKVYNLR